MTDVNQEQLERSVHVIVTISFVRGRQGFVQDLWLQDCILAEAIVANHHKMALNCFHVSRWFHSASNSPVELPWRQSLEPDSGYVVGLLKGIKDHVCYTSFVAMSPNSIEVRQGSARSQSAIAIYLVLHSRSGAPQ